MTDKERIEVIIPPARGASVVGVQWGDVRLARMDIDPVQERDRELAQKWGARIPHPFENVAGGTA